MSRLLGIDGGKTSFRAALVRTSYKRVTVEAFGEASIAEAGSEIEAIRAAVGALKPDAAAIALSGERTFYRRIDLPAAAQKEVQNVLAFELEATVPFEMTDAVFDYRLLKRDPGLSTVPVLAALARTEDVKERIQVVQSAIGIEPERVGTGAFPLMNLDSVMPELEQAPGSPTAGSPLAILNLGDTTSDLMIIEGGEPVFARTISKGTSGLPGTAPALARELRQTLAAWRTMGGDPLGGMYLVGGGASAQGAELFLGTELGVSILPLPRPRVEGLTPEQQVMLPRFAMAIGLALGLTGRSKAPNLRRGALEAERSYPFLREKIPLLAGLGAVIAMSFGFSIIAEIRSLDAENELLRAKLAVATRDVLGEETDDPARAQELLEPAGTATEEDPLPHADAFDVMVQLSKAVPKEITHDVVELDFTRQHAVIQGVVSTVSDAQLIAEAMKEHKCFKDVKVARTSQYTQDRQKYVLEFDVKCDTKKKKTTGAEPDGTAQPATTAKPDTKTETQR